MTGKVIWSRDVMADNDAKLPIWGFSGSPLVYGGLVLVITGGEGKAVAAYDRKTGAPAWAKGAGWGYCSPQLARLGGVEQILFVSDKGLASLDPADGHPLWQNDYDLGPMGGRCIQPAVIGDNDVLFGAAFDTGTRRVRVEKSGDQWTQKTVWTCKRFNPYYNDMVYQDGYCYGFNNSFLACIDVTKGEVVWKARGYGNGQVLLIADQKLLLIQAESGDVALMEAKPDDHNELARFSALDDKTWNHPVIVNGKLFVRNGKEIACYDVAAK
jgi:outer membrane protein assembly factor BamB